MSRIIQVPTTKDTCMRCGGDRKDIQRKGYYYPCVVYGNHYGNHRYFNANLPDNETSKN